MVVLLYQTEKFNQKYVNTILRREQNSRDHVFL